MYQSDKYKLFPLYCFIIMLPYILLYWMVPFLSDIRLSADYPILIKEQIELLFSIKNGSFPLFAPGFHFGHSSSALTMGQLYHPISHIASLMPGYWNGKALEWVTFFRLFSLGLTQLALFSFLRKIRLNTLFAFIISLITVYNLRMLEAFRYGAALEAFTGNLLLCAMIGRYYISPSKWLGPLSIIGVTYLLVCSGHPPMMFYGFIAVVLFTLVIPFLVPLIVHDRDFDIKNTLSFWAKAVLCMCAGILLSADYLIPLYVEFVSNNATYSQSSGLIGVEAPETLAGALNNFFMPFFADLLGSFGGSSLIIIALLLPFLRCFKVKIPGVIWFLWGTLLYVILHILGPGTPVYVWVHNNIPFVASLGGVGRIAMIVPPIIMLLMAWIINREAIAVRINGRSLSLSPGGILGLAALILTPVYILLIFLLRPSFGYFTPHFIRNIPFWIEIISIFFGLLSLAIFVGYNMYPRLVRVMGILLCLIVLVQVGTILKYGIFIEENKDEPTFEQLKAQKKESLDYRFLENPNAQHRVVSYHLNRSFMEPFLGKIFTQSIPAASQEGAYNLMQKEWLPQQVFIEGFDEGRAKELTEGAKEMRKGMVELVYSSFNRLQFRVTSREPAFFGLAYPYTGHWRAWVNSQEVRTYRGNGAAHAIEIPAGESLIEFRYWSDAFFRGVLITCLVFVMIGVYICSRTLTGSLRAACIALIIVTGTGGFVLWYNSLYSGDNLNTKYQWVYTPPKSPVNIAYGKKTYGNAAMSDPILHRRSSSAVDGYVGSGAGFPVGSSDDMVLIVDLNRSEEIKLIVLHGEIIAEPEIYLSQDGIEWNRPSSTIPGDYKKDTLRIIFKMIQVQRYIKVKSSEGTLYLDELEVYRAL